MQPRLKSSVKWTKLPQDITEQIRELFKQNFQTELQNADVIVEGRLYRQEIVLRVGYLEKGRLTQNNFEISMDYKLTNEDSATKTLNICVDAAGALMAEHFESDGELELPYTWTEFPFEGKKVWLQFSTTNSNLEKQASALLGEDDDSLVQGEVDEAEDVGLGEEAEANLSEDLVSEDDADESAETSSDTEDEDEFGDEDEFEDEDEDEDEDETSETSSADASKLNFKKPKRKTPLH